MDDEKKTARAVDIYSRLCKMLDERGWGYTSSDEELVIDFTVWGDDLDMRLKIFVIAERQLIRLLSPLPFHIKPDNSVNMSAAVVYVNSILGDGSFNYDVESGLIVYRMTASFLDSDIGEGLLQYMVDCSTNTVDKYNDRLFAVSLGYLSLTDFLEGK